MAIRTSLFLQYAIECKLEFHVSVAILNTEAFVYGHSRNFLDSEQREHVQKHGTIFSWSCNTHSDFRKDITVRVISPQPHSSRQRLTLRCFKVDLVTQNRKMSPFSLLLHRFGKRL